MSKCRLLQVKNKGFALLELLIAITLSVLLMGSLYGIYLVNQKSYSRSIAKAELNQNARIALERITRDLRQTDRITTTLPPDDTDPTNPPPSEIMFADGHDTDQIRYIIYTLENGNLYRKLVHYSFSTDPANPDWVNWNTLDDGGQLPNQHIDENVVKADKVTDLKFYGVRLITIELIASDGKSDYDFKTQTLARNI